MSRLSIRLCIFNFRFSRAGRAIECSYGLLKTEWQIFKSPLAYSLKHIEMIIMATLCLHNYFLTTELVLAKENKKYTAEEEVEEDYVEETSEINNAAKKIRDSLKDYFMT